MFQRLLHVSAAAFIALPCVADPRPAQQIQPILNLLEQVAPQLVLDARESLQVLTIDTDPNLIEDLNARELTLVGRDSLDGGEAVPPAFMGGPDRL